MPLLAEEDDDEPDTTDMGPLAPDEAPLLTPDKTVMLPDTSAEDTPEDERAFTRRLRAAILFIDSNRGLPLLSWPGQIIDGLLECEQASLVFRQRHARMVERVIGRRVGTGGSDGVDYLDQTALKYRIFTEIWGARTLLLPPDLCPTIKDRAFYGLAQN